MKKEKMYLVGTHWHSFKRGVPGEIKGIFMCTPEGGIDFKYEPRPCYHVEWSDGKEDYIAVDAKEEYVIVSFKDVLNGNYPKGETKFSDYRKEWYAKEN